MMKMKRKFNKQQTSERTKACNDRHNCHQLTSSNLSVLRAKHKRKHKTKVPNLRFIYRDLHKLSVMTARSLNIDVAQSLNRYTGGLGSSSATSVAYRKA